MKNKTLWLLVFLTFLLFFLGIGQLPLYILDEAKNAECAREMWEKSNLIIPTFNGELRTDKPPLHYFFMMLAHSIFGVSAFAARFFSALMGVLTLGATFCYTRKNLGQKTAIWTILTLLSSLHFLFQFHLAVPDPYLIACITIAIFTFREGLEDSSRKQLFFGYTATALGVLAKGPVALSLIGLVLLLYLIFTKQLNEKGLKKLRIPLGATWFLVLVLPWYIAVGRATGGAWLEGFFFTHNLNRFTDAMENHGGGFWMTWIYVLVGMLPFVLFLPATIRRVVFPKIKTASKSQDARFLLLTCLAVLVIIGFFTISTTKLPNYTVPAYPFLAVLLGYYFSQKTHFSWLPLLLWTLIGIAMPVGLFFGVKSYELLNGFEWLAWLFVPLALGGISSLVFHFWKQVDWSLRSILIGNIVSAILLFSIGLPKVFQQNPVAQSMYLLENQEELMIYKNFNPAYLFNLERTIPKAKVPLTLQQQFNKQPGTIILTQERYLKDLRFFPYPLDTIFIQQDLFEQQRSVLLRHKKVSSY
ncbi:MAG: glycosyltransferase family 39 protein [Bacteroidota bacterium]